MMDCYEIVTNIGKGSSGAVYLARSNKTKRPVAIKKIIVDESRRSRCRKSVMREANIMLSLDHSHIVKCYEWFLDEQTEVNISMVLEFCNGGTLQDKILNTKLSRSQFCEDQIGRWTAQITSAVDYIHKRRILHRDLKSENVFLLKDDTIKLGDFGISKDLNHTLDKANTCVGTPCYLSPELCQDVPYSFKSDIWALGCLVFEMCALKPAFDAHNLISLFHKIVTCKFADVPLSSSAPLKEFISAILVADPDKRPTAAQLLKMNFLRPFNVDVGENPVCKDVVKVEKVVEEPDWSALDDLDELLKTSEEPIRVKQDEEEEEVGGSTSSESSDDDGDVTSATRRNHENEEDSINGWSGDDSDSTFDEINSHTLSSSKGLDDEIPEIIEAMEEALSPPAATTASNLATSSGSSGGFGSKLPGSVWLHSRRAQALRQRNPIGSPTKIITGVQRQKLTKANLLRHSCDVTSTLPPTPPSKCDVTPTTITSSKPPKRTSTSSLGESDGDVTPRISPNHPPPRSIRPPQTASNTTEVNLRNLPGSAWLYGKKQREQTEVDRGDDFSDDDDYDDDFEDEDDDVITVNPAQPTSSTQQEDVK